MLQLSDRDVATVVARLRAAGCVFAEDETRLIVADAETPAELETIVARRVQGEPLEHVLGWVEFCGLRIAVDAGVFVPRKRTEFLVRQAAKLARPGDIVVDLCCGSGAVGVALAHRVGTITLYGSDVEPNAVACARRNFANLGGRVFGGDLYEALPNALRGTVDILVVNAPYVPSDTMRFMPTEAREHEPAVTRDGGADGLDVQRRIVAEARDWLAPDGHLLIETSERQAQASLEILREGGLVASVARSRILDATVVIGMHPRL